MTSLHAQVPEDAYVTAAQAESSLGHNLADELDDCEHDDAADRDLRAWHWSAWTLIPKVWITLVSHST